jgi:hypothetical protein
MLNPIPTSDFAQFSPFCDCILAIFSIIASSLVHTVASLHQIKWETMMMITKVEGQLLS